MSAENKNHNGVILFSHCPKTAGTTVRHILKSNFDDDRVVDLDAHINTYCAKLFGQRPFLVMGGFYYGIHRVIDFRASTFNYITFIRNPVDLVISLYFFCRANVQTDLHDLAIRSENAIEWAKSCERPQNSQVRFLCGYDSEINVHLALDRLFNQYLFFGMVDYMMESICLMGQLLNLNRVNYSVLNRTPRDPMDGSQYSKIEEVLMEKEHLDIALYVEAKKRFELILKALHEPNNDTYWAFLKEMRKNEKND
jgi:hypothetical protein